MASTFKHFIQEIEMSSRSLQNQNYVFRQTPQLTQIKPSIVSTIFTILRQDSYHLAQPTLRIYKKLPIIYISPLSRVVAFWNFIIIFVAYFLCFQISLTLGFGPQWWHNQLQKAMFQVCYAVLIFLLLTDVFINFNKGFYAFGYGKIIDDKTIIKKKYLKSYFIPDIICIGLLIVPLLQNHYFLNFLQIVTIVLLFVKKFKCQAQIVRYLQYQPNLRSAFIIFMLGCDVMLLGNFGACIFLGIDLLLWRIQFFGNNPQYYWLSNNSSYSVDLMGGSWIAQYIFAQSFSTGTLSTLAPGPFGKNPIQITYQLFVMTFFMILASYVGEVLVSILYVKTKVRIFHEQIYFISRNNIQKFDNYMSLKRVASKIRVRVHNFFQLIWQFQIKNDAQGQQKIIQKLPLSLQQDLISQLGFSNQLKVPAWFQNQQDLRKIIAFKIITTIVDPNATIFQIGSPLDTVGQGYIIYIKNGLAKYYFPFEPKNRTISLSNTQKLAGEYQFVTGLSHAFCCKSIDLSVIQKIPYSAFMALIRNFQMIEEFFVLKCKILFNNDMYLVGQSCMICDKRHRENACPQLFIAEQIKKQFKQQLNDTHNRLHSNNKRRSRKRNQFFSKKLNQNKQNEQHVLNNMMEIVSKVGHKKAHRKNLKYQNLNQISDQIKCYLTYYPEYNTQN